MHIKSDGPQGLWTQAVLMALDIIERSPIPLGNAFGEGNEPTTTDKGIYTNGIGDDGHETLFIPSVLTLGDFEFCKTARKPYDLIVTAVYATLAHIGGVDCVEVSSDGCSEDWVEGCDLASEILGQTIPNPIEEREG